MGESYMIDQNSELVSNACKLANELHKDQLRKGTKTPYFEHLAGVAMFVKIAGGTNNQIIAAFLHDSIEDQKDKIDIYQIEKQFGPIVSEIVMDCTEDKSIKDWTERKMLKLQKMHNQKINPLSNLVVLCDKLHNAESIVIDFTLVGDIVWDRFKMGPEKTVWWYQECYRALAGYFGINFPLVKRFENNVYLLEKIADRRKNEIKKIENYHKTTESKHGHS